MLFALLLSVVALATAVPARGKCPRGNWSDWSECKANKVCTSAEDMKVLTETYQMEETTYDKGREAMKRMMAHKNRLAAEREACLAAGGCKDLYKSSQAFTPCVNGFAGEYPCRNVDMLSFVSLVDQGFTSDRPGGNNAAGNDIWVWHDTLNNDYYAIACTTGGTSFIRITDPYNPQVLGFLQTHSRPATWRDAKVINDVAYIVADVADHGMQVFDLIQLRGMQATVPVRTFQATVHYGRFGNSHNIAANVETNTLYAVGCTQSGYDSCNGGLHMIDVSERLNPVFAGCYAFDGYTHDTQCVIYRGPDATYQGREICFGFNEDSLTIVDVTVRSNPVMVSKTAYDSQYTHQGWITDDHTVVLLDDELDEMRSLPNQQHTKTYVWDVKDLDNPVLMSVYKSSEQSIDHNQYISNGYTFQSNYEAGLRILHIDQANFALTEVAYFDVYPPSTTANFQGTWSNYPWLPNGIVAVQGIDYGMYLLQPNYPAMEQAVAEHKLYAEQTRTCGSAVEVRECVPEVQC